MKLKELLPFQYKLKEAEGKKGVIGTVEGIFQRADAKNANGRIYPLSLWQSVLGKSEVQERLQSRQMVGMFGHPADGITDEERISHVITKQELRQDGTVYGEADIMDTPSGRIVKTLLDAGVKLGISSRGDGSVEKDGGTDIVQSDFRLETYDFVLKPSTPGAYPTLAENVEENERLVTQAIDGLLKSNLDGKQRLPVMLECLQILSALDASNNDLVKSLSKRITEEVRNPSKVLISVVAEEKKTIKQESTMSGTGNPQFDAQTLAWHASEVRKAQNVVASKANEEIKKLKEEIIKLQRNESTQGKKLAAAESIIEGFQKKVKEIKESKQVATDGKLVKAHEAAKDLLDEAIKALPQIGVLRRRVKALESLLQAAVVKVKGDKVSEAVKKAMAQIPESQRPTVAKLFEACRTPEEVAEHFKALTAMSQGRTTTRVQREPLPNSGKNNGKNLSEGQNGNSSTPAPASFQDRMKAKLNRAVS